MVGYDLDLIEFLNCDGGIELLLAIDTETGTRHTEFEKIMAVSRATVSKRIGEAKDLDLLEIQLLSDDHGNAKRYTLSQIGRVLRVALESMELDDTYQTYLESKQELDDGAEVLEEWIADNQEFWSSIDYDNEFSLNRKLKYGKTYPGDNIRSDLDDYLSEPKSLREQLEDARKDLNQPKNPDED